MDTLDLLQWPAMAITVAAAWLIASRSPHKRAGIELVHVPYKGEPQALTDLVAGRVQMMFCSSSTSVPQIREGKLRALVTTLGSRSHLLPEVPTIGEGACRSSPSLPGQGSSARRSCGARSSRA